MADLEFAVAKRNNKPITFTLGGEALLQDAVPAIEADKEAGIEAVAEIPAIYGQDDHEYKFNPPKNAVMLMPIFDRDKDDDEMGIGLTRSTFDWLGDGLSEDDNQRILRRLRDSKDDLDTDTLNQVIEGLSEQVGGRPTT